MTEEEEDCGICGLSFNGKYSYQMKCNHKFHYECLMKTFKKSKLSAKYTHNNCPYCRNAVEFLPIVSGLKKAVMGVHSNNYQDLKSLNESLKSNNYKCKFTLSRGKNKGNECSKSCSLGFEYCKTHITSIQKKQNLIKDLQPNNQTNNQPTNENTSHES